MITRYYSYDHEINNKEGEFVMYEDHQAIVDKLKADKKTLVDRLKLEHEWYCDMVRNHTLYDPILDKHTKKCITCKVLKQMETEE